MPLMDLTFSILEQPSKRNAEVDLVARSMKAYDIPATENRSERAL